MASGADAVVVGADGYDDDDIRAVGENIVITRDDGNVVLGGTGDVNSQIGDSEQGAVIMDVNRTYIQGGGGTDDAAPWLSSARKPSSRPRSSTWRVSLRVTSHRVGVMWMDRPTGRVTASSIPQPGELVHIDGLHRVFGTCTLVPTTASTSNESSPTMATGVAPSPRPRRHRRRGTHGNPRQPAWSLHLDRSAEETERMARRVEHDLHVWLRLVLGDGGSCLDRPCHRGIDVVGARSRDAPSSAARWARWARLAADSRPGPGSRSSSLRALQERPAAGRAVRDPPAEEPLVERGERQCLAGRRRIDDRASHADRGSLHYHPRESSAVRSTNSAHRRLSTAMADSVDQSANR